VANKNETPDNPLKKESDDSSSLLSSPESSLGRSSGSSGGRSLGPALGSLAQIPIWAKGALLIAILLLASVGYFSRHFTHAPNEASQNALPSGEPETDPEELAKREPVHDIILTDAEGKQKKLSEYKGNVVILSFWASWCTPCLLELPTFGELEKKFHERGLRIVPINVDEGPEGKTFARDFWNKWKFTFPNFFDATGQLQHEFDIGLLPTNFVIDRQGRLVLTSDGANDWNTPQMTDMIDGLLKESVKDPGQG
jgi:thiol-disulfide isomerase/thioredoxin